ncbi:hypothetical protein Tco_1173999 [Tanacetum coccineum]
MNQNFYNSNSSGFDQIQPLQYPVIHHPPQEMSKEILQAKKDLMKSIQTFLKKFNRISFRETPKVLLLAWEKFFEIQHAQPEDIQELLHKLLKDLQIIREELAEYINCPSWNFPMIDDDDDEHTIQYRLYLERSSKAITPDLSTEEPDNSLSMGDEHLDTISETESNEVIKSSVEDLVPIPSESEGIFDNMCDVPSCDKKHFDAESDLKESLLNRDTLIVYSPKIDSLLKKFAGELAPINPIPSGIHEADFDPKEDIRLDDQMFYDDTSSDDDSFEDINYVEASPPNSELIKSLNDNPTPSFLSHSDNSLPEFETFSNHAEETRSGSTTTHAENSLPEYDSFHFEIESDQGELSRVVMETIDEIDAFLDIDVSTDLEDGYHDSEGDIIYLESLLINNTIPNLSPEVFFDHEQKCLKDEPNNLISMVKVFDPGIPEKFFSLTYVRLSFEDRHYLSFTYFLFIRAGGMRESDDNFSINLFLPQGQRFRESQAETSHTSKRFSGDKPRDAYLFFFLICLLIECDVERLASSLHRVRCFSALLFGRSALVLIDCSWSGFVHVTSILQILRHIAYISESISVESVLRGLYRVYAN